MNEITIAVKYDNDNPTVSGRELHAALMVDTRYNDWFKRMCEYDFIEGRDYYSFLSNRSDGLAGKPRTDHQLTIDMAKELCMIQRTEIGKRCREYFINLEKQWNSPDAVMARALQIADQKLELNRGDSDRVAVAGRNERFSDIFIVYSCRRKNEATAVQVSGKILLLHKAVYLRITLNDHCKSRCLHPANIELSAISDRKQSRAVHTHKPVCSCTGIACIEQVIVCGHRLHIIKCLADSGFLKRRNP